MIQIIDNLYVGAQSDFENNIFDKGWSHLLAAKEPFHRQTIGYTGRACSKLHPEYLLARRDNKLIMNLVDAPKPEFFNKDLIDAGLMFIEEELFKGQKVSIHCNMGESRSASIGMLYLIMHRHIKGDTLEDCEAEFLKIYPAYNPGTGMRGFVKENFEYYRTHSFEWTVEMLTKQIKETKKWDNR